MYAKINNNNFPVQLVKCESIYNVNSIVCILKSLSTIHENNNNSLFDKSKYRFTKHL